jgi:hypothetical protein
MSSPTQIPPLPNPNEIFTAIKSSSKKCRLNTSITINQQAIHTLLTQITSNPKQWTTLSTNHGTKVPSPLILS